MTDISKIDMNRIEGLLSLLESIDYVVESKLPTEEDPSWYRLYKSGWLEQGGYKNTTNTNTTINLLKPFKDTTYSLQTTGYGVKGNYGSPCNDKTISSFTTFQDYAVHWEAKGQSA